MVGRQSYEVVTLTGNHRTSQVDRARLMGMVNKSELSINTVRWKRANWG